jgi:hypothetical protein
MHKKEGRGEVMKEGLQENTRRGDKGRKRKCKFTVTNCLRCARYLTVNELARTLCGKTALPYRSQPPN